MKQKYLLDAENLVFQREQNRLKSKVKSILNYFCIGAGLALGFWIVFFSGWIGSPQNTILRNSNDKLVSELSDVTAKFDSISQLLAEIQHKDDHCYRVISEIEPLSKARRMAGFGGTDKYKDLKGYSNSDLLIESAKKGDILDGQLRIQAESYDTIIRFVRSRNDSLLAIPAILPVGPTDYHRISDRFGKRVHPVTRKVHQHTGIDFAARIGKPIYAAGNGEVVAAKKSRFGYGNKVIIKHGYGFKTLYAHMHTMDVKIGDKITRGQKIGTVGNTGTSTGPHLHYEVIYNNVRKNPESYFIQDLTDQEYEEMIQLFTYKN